MRYTKTPKMKTIKQNLHKEKEDGSRALYITLQTLIINSSQCFLMK